MNNTHEHEKKQFIRLFRQQGVDQFDLRFQVLDAFLKLEHHVTIRDINQQLDQDGQKIDLTFIENSMELLCRFGFASKIILDEKEPQYEHRHLGVHHDHMVCTKCSAIIEFKDEAIELLQLKVAEAYGFHMLQHKMEIYGICSNCKATSSKLLPLHKARQGEQLIIREIEAGQNMLQRISSMGLKIGDKIEIVSSGFGGQVVIASAENRLVIGKGMAEKIRVESVEASKDEKLFTAAREYVRTITPAVKLSEMKAGQEGVIRKVSGEGILKRRLLEMGINRGTNIYVEKYAPLKDPVELVVKGYHISLRVEEAANILVEDVRVKKK